LTGQNRTKNMSYADDTENPGPFEARYLDFLETITNLRPRLHRYCARMTGSVMDGEDLVQEALFHAYRNLDSFDETRALEPWLFRIAHNRCIDYLRRREVQRQAEAQAVLPDSVLPVESDTTALGHAIEHLVLTLPPMERAAVLLKDVFDYSLAELATLLESNVGAVKSALNRARSKLAISSAPPRRHPEPDTHAIDILTLYVDHFNRHDWDGIRQLAATDARLRVADRFSGSLSDAPYFRNYERSRPSWRMVPAAVDGEPAILTLREHAGEWIPQSIARLDVSDNGVTRITDYLHCPWVLPAALSTVVWTPEPTAALGYVSSPLANS
jgi:RNA polymerase sigma-70 factor, ECF subfamily